MDGWKKISASIADLPCSNPSFKNSGTSPKDTAAADRIPAGMPIQANVTAWLFTSVLI